tara:strand:- start:297 stop:614 length:318 start_codon:yes stop_codon:yes gene_type:complete
MSVPTPEQKEQLHRCFRRIGSALTPDPGMDPKVLHRMNMEAQAALDKLSALIRELSEPRQHVRIIDLHSKEVRNAGEKLTFPGYRILQIEYVGQLHLAVTLEREA